MSFYKTSILISALVLTVLGTLTYLRNQSPTANAQTPPETDWPQFGRTPQRTNYSPQNPPTIPMPILWDKALTDFGIEHRIYGSTQIIFAPVNGNPHIFLGDLSGTIYAFNARTGSLLWQFSTDGPITHTLGYLNNRIIAANLKSSVYALDVATGTQVWRINTGRRTGFSSAVLLAENNIFLVDTGGSLYSISAVNGNILWTNALNTPVLASPAYNNGVIYVPTEKMQIAAINSVNGTLKWLSSPQLEGMSFIDTYPVITNNMVIVSSRDGLEPYHDQLTAPDPPIDSLQAVNEQDGTRLPHIPHYLAGAMNGAHSPPAVTNDGKIPVSWFVRPDLGFAGWGWALINLTDLSSTVMYPTTTGSGNVGMGAPTETFSTSIFGNHIFVLHHMGFRGNPNVQSGSFNQTNSMWTAWVNTNKYSAYGSYCSQAGGSAAISGTGSILCHQGMDVIRCWGQ